ncbi:MAG: hypothetical protein IT378_10385 [Sandaracinaceae bacterium]|nr:hypothetical protein [Sandaracinaceae bacterium]
MTIRDVVRAGLFALTTTTLAACGGGAAAPEQTASAGGEEGHHHHGHGPDHDHGAMPAEMSAFHDVLRPVWHGEEGAARAQAACDASASFTERAQAVAGASAPEGIDASAWTAAGANLVAKVQALSTACSADPTTAGPALAEVHDAFHALMDLVH